MDQHHLRSISCYEGQLQIQVIQMDRYYFVLKQSVFVKLPVNKLRATPDTSRESPFRYSYTQSESHQGKEVPTLGEAKDG